MLHSISGIVGPFGRLTARTSSGSRLLRAHVHAELTLLVHCGGSTLTMRVGDDAVVLGAGEMLAIDAFELHAPMGGGDEPRTIVNLLLDRRWFDRLAGEHEPQRRIEPFAHRAVAMDADSQACAARIATACLAEPLADVGEVEALVGAMAEAALRQAARFEDGPRWCGTRGRADARIRRVVEHFVAHPAEPFDAQRAAVLAGMSRAQFFRSFKAGMGCPPRYVADAGRVDYSVRALLEPRLPIAEIADSLGFSAPAHFTQFFADHLGVPPGEYRRNLVRS